MDTRKLRYFVDIVDAGSISRAADFLNLAQPALSQHLASLETEFGRRLLVRTRRGVSPTPEGQLLYRYAQGILRLEHAVTVEMKSAPSGLSGQVSIGLGSYSCANEFGVRILHTVQQLYPDVSLLYIDNLTVIFSKAIKMGLLDAAIIYDAGPISGVRFEPIRTEDIYLVAAPGLRVVEPGATEITVDELSALEVFLPPSHHVLRQIVERGFAQAGQELRIRAEIAPPSGLYHAVAAGLGVACLPRSVAEEIFRDDGFQILRIVEPSMSATFALCTSDRQPMSEAAAAVIGLLRDEINASRNPAGPPGVPVELPRRLRAAG